VLGRITVMLGDEVVGEYTLTAPRAVQELRFLVMLQRLINALVR
jgi:hypothetical protein